MSVRSLQLATLIISAALVSTVARAQDGQIWSCSGADCFPSTTTTLSTTSTTAGVVVLIVMLVKKDDKKAAPRDSAKAAELYLRQNALQLAQDLASGSGPVIEELSSALRVSSENKALFAERLRQERKDLLALADPRTLDTPRAVLFVKRLADLMQADPALSRDLGRLTATAAN